MTSVFFLGDQFLDQALPLENRSVSTEFGNHFPDQGVRSILEGVDSLAHEVCEYDSIGEGRIH